MKLLDQRLALIAACSRQRQQWQKRHLQLDCLTTELLAQSHAALRRSRRTLADARPPKCSLPREPAVASPLGLRTLGRRQYQLMSKPLRIGTTHASDEIERILDKFKKQRGS